LYQEGRDWFMEGLATGSATAGLPFFGVASTAHLRMNLGLPTAKPDRHLVRIAARWGYSDVQAMCHAICSYTGDDIRMVDRVLWYSSIRKATARRGQALSGVPQSHYRRAPCSSVPVIE
jgi:hypothetical protein